ncbi:MAG TPA: LysR substrate-binding domain-containing protein, partial [Nitriliruptoraceae bacterium]|nr:LysR substrate-binding domain-containing protein [Nitriliruptoraceae bacterium]
RLVVPAAWGEVDCITDLADAPWTFEPVGSQAYGWCVDYCRSRGLEPDVRYEFDDLMIRLRFIETGHAATLLPELGASVADQDRVRVIGLADEPSRRIQTVVRTATVGHPAIVAFRHAIGEVANGADGRTGEGQEQPHWRTPRRTAG